MTIKAIETRYAGHRFRSRLEARWAVFFDHAEVRWEYEAEGYETPQGRYLPDFVLHLPTGPTLFEVKPESDLGNEDPRWRLASRAANARLVVAYGMPRLTETQPSAQPGNGLLNLYDSSGEWDSWDNFYGFCVCPSCGATGLEFDGRGARVCGWNTHGTGEDKGYSYDHPKLLQAYAAAHSARFEHGEKGSRFAPPTRFVSGPDFGQRACCWCGKVIRGSEPRMRITDEGVYSHVVCP